MNVRFSPKLSQFCLLIGTGSFYCFLISFHFKRSEISCDNLSSLHKYSVHCTNRCILKFPRHRYQGIFCDVDNIDVLYCMSTLYVADPETKCEHGQLV